MKIWKTVVPCLLGLVVAGCRTDPSIALLERDNNRKELEIYRLKCRVEDLQEQLDSAAPQPLLPHPAAQGDILPGPGTAGSARPGAAVTLPAPAHESPAPSDEEPELPGVEMPRILPGTLAPPGEVPSTIRGPGGSSQWKPSDVRLASGAAAADDTRAVAQITLHPSLTGGIGSGASGDEGLLVVVEPRDFAGKIIAVAGGISVALLDPALQGEQARLARWDFSAAQTERMIHTGAEPGIHLRLPWRSAPAHDRLEVFVRFTTRDGRKLQADRLIAVALGDSRPARLESPPPAEPERTATRPDRPQWSPER
jgi:hypothetical protein